MRGTDHQQADVYSYISTEVRVRTDLITRTMPLLPAKISDNVDAAGGFKYPLGIRNTAPFDVLGVTAISIPCGFTMSGLPIGLQIAAAPFAVSTVLALAHA